MGVQITVCFHHLAIKVLAILIAATATIALQYACDFNNNQDLRLFPFCNTALSDETRARDLVSRLTLDEKFRVLVNSATNVSRLGLPKYEWWNEALHGLTRGHGVDFTGSIREATMFPAPIMTAAAFNSVLWNQIGQVVSTEARAFYNVGRANLTYWSPNINIVRDPRWGRTQETSGEDPLLTSTYAKHFVKGMQEGTDYVASKSDASEKGPKRLKVSACCKHYIAYDLDNWEGMDRYHFDAQVTAQDLEDSYNPPFQSCVQEGKASSLMCSYNRVNGVPSCASFDFLSKTVRSEWHLDGYIVSDCGAVLDMYRDTPYAPTSEDAIADALNAGMDVECGKYSTMYGLSAYNQGKVNESTIDKALINQYTVRMRLGMFDGDPKTQRYGHLGPVDVCTQANQELAVEAARQGMVVLKNDRNQLPWNQSSSLTLAVIGPHGNSSVEMLGNYKGIPCKYITPLQGLTELGVRDVIFAPGCNQTICAGDDLIPDAITLASRADAIILIVGLNQTEEKEKLDRTSLLLPGHQVHLVQAVADAANGKPVALVILSGGPVDISFAKEDERIQSILWAGYPGESGGQAIAEVIFGHHNPGGKLPLTWYPEKYTNVNMMDMHMRPNKTTGYPGRTYRFYTGPVLYEFGYGLSYSKFEYQITSAPVTLKASVLQESNNEGSCEGFAFEIKVAVKNAGLRDGHETVLLYAKPPSAGINRVLLRQLVAFEKVYLATGTEVELVFTVDPCKHLSTVRGDTKHVIKTGVHELQVGNHHLRIIIS